MRRRLGNGSSPGTTTSTVTAASATRRRRWFHHGYQRAGGAVEIGRHDAQCVRYGDADRRTGPARQDRSNRLTADVSVSRLIAMPTSAVRRFDELALRAKIDPIA